MNPMNRFDLEAKLMQNYNIVDDLKTLAWYVTENQDEANTDFFTNALNGLACLQEARNAETWDIFIKTFELDEYNNNGGYDNEEEYEDRTSTK
jgi:hypothetical protein